MWGRLNACMRMDENKIVIKRPLKRQAIKRFLLFHSRYSLPLKPPVNGEKVPHFIEPCCPQTKQLFSKKRPELKIIRANLEDKKITLFFYCFLVYLLSTTKQS